MMDTLGTVENDLMISKCAAVFFLCQLVYIKVSYCHSELKAPMDVANLNPELCISVIQVCDIILHQSVPLRSIGQ